MAVHVLIVTETLDVAYVRLKNLIYANNVTGFNLAFPQTAKENASNALKIHAKTVIPLMSVNALHAQPRITKMPHQSANLALRNVLCVKITRLAVVVFMVMG